MRAEAERRADADHRLTVTTSASCVKRVLTTPSVVLQRKRIRFRFRSATAANDTNKTHTTTVNTVTVSTTSKNSNFKLERRRPETSPTVRYSLGRLS
jgi:hypothetical protein